MTNLPSKKIYVAGHNGMVGKAVLRALKSEHATNTEHATHIITRNRTELDLTNQTSVHEFFQAEQPQVVIFAAAKVGGIYANKTYPADFIYDNLMMAANTIHAAFQNGVERFLFLGSTCIYPKMAPQPMPESCLLTGELEPTNEAYAIAKIGGLKLCQFYRQQHGVTFHSAMPTNLYGPGDNYHPENSHVLPALIRRFHEAKLAGEDSVTIWGTGTPRREFLHVDDLAKALVHLTQIDNPPDLVNVGTGKDISIQELAELVAEVVGYEGTIANDLGKPDGTPVKRTDCSLIHDSGWQAEIGLEAGIRSTYESFQRETEASELRSC